MAEYQVLRPIELGGTLYLPSSVVNPPAKARSAANGAVIAVNASGVIELTEAEAKELNLGQIQAIKGEAVSTQRSANSKRKSS